MTTHQNVGQTVEQTPAQPVSVNGHGRVEEPVSLDGMAVSEEEYWAEYYEKSDISYEWNNGILEEKPSADYRRATQYGWFLILLRVYLETHPVAKMLFLEMGFRLALSNKTTIRKPDLFVIRNDNPVPLGDRDFTYRGIGDLCVESLSVSTKKEIERDTVVKKSEYEGIGVQEYYILDPDDRTVFYQRNPLGKFEPIQADAEGILRSQVLPGFQFRLADLFSLPTLEDLADDPIYSSYILLKYQTVKQRAELAEERAEVAKKRAELAKERTELAENRAELAEERAAAEKARADRYAAILRDLGIPGK